MPQPACCSVGSSPRVRGRVVSWSNQQPYFLLGQKIDLIPNGRILYPRPCGKHAILGAFFVLAREKAHFYSPSGALWSQNGPSMRTNVVIFTYAPGVFRIVRWNPVNSSFAVSPAVLLVARWFRNGFMPESIEVRSPTLAPAGQGIS